MCHFARYVSLCSVMCHFARYVSLCSVMRHFARSCVILLGRASLCYVMCHFARSYVNLLGPGPEVIKLFSCSTQLGKEFVLLKHLKLLTVANSFLPNIPGHENFFAYKYEKANNSWHFHIYW